eukprot:Skav200540  [mRNA]  locus=scaffold676:231620:240684:- [translate_table: standard]
MVKCCTTETKVIRSSGVGRVGQKYSLEAFMLLYSFGLSVSYMGVIGTEVAVLARLSLAQHFGQVIVVCMVPWASEAPFVDACGDATGGGLSLVTWHSSPVALLAAVPMSKDPPRSSVLALIWLAQSFALLDRWADYLVSGAAGYVSFCQQAPDNVLDGFPLTHWPSLLARMAIALQLTCACSGVYIPLARAALTHLTIGLDSGAPQGALRCLFTVALVSSMVLVARLLDGALALPLGLTSAVCTTAIMRLGPRKGGRRWMKGRGSFSLGCVPITSTATDGPWPLLQRAWSSERRPQLRC